MWAYYKYAYGSVNLALLCGLKECIFCGDYKLSSDAITTEMESLNAIHC